MFWYFFPGVVRCFCTYKEPRGKATAVMTLLKCVEVGLIEVDRRWNIPRKTTGLVFGQWSSTSGPFSGRVSHGIQVAQTDSSPVRLYLD